jgi:hypothetical protein
MQDPVVDSLGHTYERSAIENWLAQNPNLCPTTSQTYQAGTGASLRPNWAVKKAIAEYLESIDQTPDTYFIADATPVRHIEGAQASTIVDLQIETHTKFTCNDLKPEKHKPTLSTRKEGSNSLTNAKSPASVAPLPFDGPHPPLPRTLHEQSEVDIDDIPTFQESLTTQTNETSDKRGVPRWYAM